MNPIENYLGERFVAFAKKHNANARGMKVLLAAKLTLDLAVVIGVLGLMWLFVSAVALV